MPDGKRTATINIHVTGNPPVFVPTILSSSVGWADGDIVNIPGSQLYGMDGVNDLTFTVATTLGSDEIDTIGPFSGVAEFSYSDMVFTLPTTLQNVVYVDWLLTDFTEGFIPPMFMSVKEFPQTGVLTSNIPYWKSFFGNITNTAPDRLSISLWSKKTYNTLTVQLFNPSGKLAANIKAHWAIELIVYSLANN
jgi:hypothetical protein